MIILIILLFFFFFFFFWDDGVHLSDIGSDLFLAHVQEALRSFIKTDKVMYSANE